MIELEGVARTLVLTLRARAAEHERADRLFADEAAARWYREMPGDADLDEWYNPAFEVSSNIRARIIDDLARRFIQANPDGWIVEIGAGLTTRRHRLGGGRWLLVDLPPVVDLLRRFEAESRACRFLPADLRHADCLADVPIDSSVPLLLIAEGVLPFLSKSQVLDLLDDLEGRWPSARMAFDLPHPIHLDMLNQRFERIGAPPRWSVEAAELPSLGLEVIEVSYLLTAFPKRWDEVPEIEERDRVPELSPYVALVTWKGNR